MAQDGCVRPGPLSIAMVCDYFYPKSGGIESHILCLSRCLVKRGHKVIVISHAYNDTRGVRHMQGGVKVYYLTCRTVAMDATFPSLFSSLPIIKDILEREKVDIVHGHQTVSSLAMEALVHARILSISRCFTDHSVFRPSALEGPVLVGLLRYVVSDVDGCICVSYTGKENTCRRSGLPLSFVHVIPNAVIPDSFLPGARVCTGEEIVVVVVSRLVYRKGADLLISVVPEVCKRDPRIQFVIAGDGDRRELLEQMRETHSLEKRVSVLGNVEHSEVRDVLVRGDIFLNTSLTEAFCIAILEAASCGLVVVSTDVGGVGEVLPEDMAILVEPEVASVVEGVIRATGKIGAQSKSELHSRIRSIYSWEAVAERTERVYRTFKKRAQDADNAVLDMISVRSKEFSIIFRVILVYEYLLYLLLEYARRLKEKARAGATCA